MSTQLREELTALAETQTFSPDPSAWDRGRRARRRTRVSAAVAVLVVVAGLGGGAALWSTTDREARTASGEVVGGGAIPSRIEDAPPAVVNEDLAMGPASVAFISSRTGEPMAIGAEDGRYHLLELPDPPDDSGLVALSPDGMRLAWSNAGRVHAVDLVDGTDTFFGSDAEHAEVTSLRWAPDSGRLLWNGFDDRGKESGGVFIAGEPAESRLPPSALLGIPSPTGQIVAVASDGTVDAAPFALRRGKAVARTLAADLYPAGASVTPLGWTQDHLVLAEVDGPPGSYVEGPHLALFTSPDRPESEWTYRIVMRDAPDVASLSVAVDLVPDLDGTSSQVLTHDFDPPGSEQGDISWLIGLGVAAAIGVLMGLRRLWRRLVG